MATLLAGCGASSERNADASDQGGSANVESALTLPSAPERAVWRVVNRTDAAHLATLGVSAAARARIAALRGGNDLVHNAAELDALALGQHDRRAIVAEAAQNPLADTACSATSTRELPGRIVVTPDESDAWLLAMIDGARASIEIEMYELSAKPIRDALVRAAQRGVHVRVILDRTRNDAQRRIDELTAAGAEAKLSSQQFSFTHEKTLLVDQRELLVFSGNFDDASFHHGRNYAVLLRDPEDIWDAVDLFEADWAGTAPDLACTRLVVSPTNSHERIVAVVNSAQHDLAIEALYASDRQVQTAIIAAKDRGVSVRVLFNDPAWGVGDATREAHTLAAAGIDVRRLPTMFIHAKLVIADRDRAFIGSENFSSNSLEKNREVGVVVDAETIDFAKLTTTFDADYAAGVDFASPTVAH